jgi:hypothetical protein
MRIRRKVLLGLAPLMSLWALGAQLSAQPAEREWTLEASPFTVGQGFGKLRTPGTKPGLQEDAHYAPAMTAFLSLLMLAAEQAANPTVHANPSRATVLAFSALAGTSLHGSIWLVTQRPSSPKASSLQQSTLLRC